MTDTAPTEPWLLATGTRHGAPVISRLRTRPPSDAERAANPLLVMISWPFVAEDDHLPSDDDLDTMGSFETSLDAAMNAGGWGVLVAVVSGQGVREWRIYTGDFDRFQAGLNDALMGQPVYPLEFATFEDSEWQAYAEIAESLQPGGEA